MRRVAAFLTRLGVFVLLAYIQSLMVSLDAVILQLDARLLLSSCQIAIFGGMLTVYLLCRWIFEIMHTSRMYNNVNMDSVNQAHNDLASLGGIPEEEAFRRLQNMFSRFGKVPKMQESGFFRMNICTKFFLVEN